MTIGLSLPLGYLTGAGDNVVAKCFSDAFGRPRDCLACLDDNGVTSIELQGFGSDTLPGELLDAADRIHRAGMHLTLHGYLCAPAPGNTSGYTQPRLLSAVDSFRDRQVEIVVVVHALESRCASSHATVEATARALAQLGEDIRTCDLPVTIGLEINRYRGVDSPATTYEGLLEIASRLDKGRIGFCWDLGHTCSSVLQGQLPPAPPPEFITRVVHTHVHGLSPEGDTHWPLTEGCPHVASNISRLEANAFSGVYNLELYPTRWTAQQNVRDGVLYSASCLRRILDAARHRPPQNSDRTVEQAGPNNARQRA